LVVTDQAIGRTSRQSKECPAVLRVVQSTGVCSSLRSRRHRFADQFLGVIKDP